MIELKASAIRPVVVETSQNGGLSAEQITELCCRKIVYVSAGAPPAIQQQAAEFRERIAGVVHHYVEEAVRSERGQCVQIASKVGYGELTDLLRRA